jgi:hypothetical protein
MKTQDFSHGFDTLLSSYAIPAEFGSTSNPGTIQLDEFEKSQLLTKSQDDTVIDLYTGRNSLGASFEQTEELRRYLANLVKEGSLPPIETTAGILGIDSSSKFFTLPEDLWFITYESVVLGADGPCGEDSRLDVVPVRQDEYNRIRKNPFRGANNRRALRLDLSDGVIEIVCRFTVKNYYLRYLRKLQPIILANLGESSIRGISDVRECELPESLHQIILDRAVMMALQSRGYTRNENK